MRNDVLEFRPDRDGCVYVVDVEAKGFRKIGPGVCDACAFVELPERVRERFVELREYAAAVMAIPFDDSARAREAQDDAGHGADVSPGDAG